jgi:hypothetical protein
VLCREASQLAAHGAMYGTVCQLSDTAWRSLVIAQAVSARERRPRPSLGLTRPHYALLPSILYSTLVVVL